jgi:AraC family transcriptional activator of pobA
MKNIPVDRLQNKTSTGFQIKAFKADEKRPNESGSAIAHRDDHYIFFLLTSGSGTLKVDFQDILLTSGHLYYVLPSQIHYQIEVNNAEGWFLAVDTSLITKDLKVTFENRPRVQLPCKLTEYELNQYKSLLGMLQIETVMRQADKFYLSIVQPLVRSFLAMAASTYKGSESVGSEHSRSAELAWQFKNLLRTHIQILKSPSAYAANLHVSTGYLNEVVKNATGSTVSYWIQEEIFSEARRLLYYSDKEVKEVAHELGYSDCSYFIRLFRKLAGVSPLEFRSLHRK